MIRTICLLLLLALQLRAQESNSYYIRYPDHLQINLFQSQKKYQIILSPRGLDKNKDGKSLIHNYIAQANTTSGFDLAFDKISFSLTFKSVSQDERTRGRTAYFNFSNSFGSQRYIVESSFRRYKSFFDDNSPNYNELYTPPAPYFINKGLRAVSFKSRMMFFSNHERFSFRSSYAMNHRQLKSAASFLMIAGAQYNNWKAETFFADDTKPYFPDINKLKKITTYSVLGGIGGSANIIFLKRLFFNITAILSPEVQIRNFMEEGDKYNLHAALSASVDTRMALGINTRHFVYSISSTTDWGLYNNRYFDLANVYLTANANIGFRLNLERIELVNRLKSNKYYRMF